MTFETSFFKFAYLHELASMGVDTYERQDALIQQCRDEGRPFLAIMPLRHMFRCDVCGVQQGEAILHFEEPRRAGKTGVGEALWPSEFSFIEVNRSGMHASIAHGEPLPAAAQEFFASSSD